MNNSEITIAATERFNRFEYPNGDFPYYNGQPTKISGSQWWFVMLMTAIGFTALIVPIPFFAGSYGKLIPAILFFAIPLAGLAIVTPAHWKAIFRKVRGRDILWMVVFAALNILVSIIMASVVLKLFGANVNPAVSGLAKASMPERILFFLKTIPQLFGEEIITVLPFLALMYFLFSRLNYSRKKSIVLAWLLSAILFGLLHLPTYKWNLIQCIVVIGSARLVLMLAYIKTKNIWVSTGAHILNDWTTFGFTILGATLTK